MVSDGGTHIDAIMAHAEQLLTKYDFQSVSISAVAGCLGERPRVRVRLATKDDKDIIRLKDWRCD